ncbi:MAG: hypothetical protein IJ257_09010 [Treponema sp.]|nr:hypothetical protein [Treponema sp.]
MKKLHLFLLFGLISACFIGCATTKTSGSGIKGKSASVNTGKRVIVDYQGATLGKEVPEWVALLVEGQYSQKVLSLVMPDLEHKKVFVTMGRGDNLDFVQTWTDLVDIETEVGGTLERVAGKAVEAEMKGRAAASGKQVEPSEMERLVNMYRASLVNVRFSGLERTASYWIETQVMDGKKVAGDYFEYYAVWKMDEKLFDKQLKEAMTKIDETSTEAKELKEIVGKKLRESVAISNDESVVNDADEFVVSN